jgi:glucarate dehydratase
MAAPASRPAPGLTVSGVEITPIALKDPPLLNASGCHEPFQLRSIIRVRTADGIVGISEAYGDDGTLSLLNRVAAVLPGLDVFDLNGLTRRVVDALGAQSVPMFTELLGPASPDKTVALAVGAFEVAFLDAQGKAVGRSVVDLLGGPVRERVDFSGYLFYKHAEHPHGTAPFEPDAWGAALDPDAIVEQARTMVRRYGFGSLKLKGGVFAPQEEIEAVKALRRAFPDHPVRLDPNANWSVEVALRAAAELDGELEYLEDPTAGIEGMAQVAARTSMPLATNMCVVCFADLPEAIGAGAVQVVLSDHHFWGGLGACQRLAGICETFGLGLSMHSNTHLGISLAAMVHVAAATPNLSYALDTHWPWKAEEVIRPGVLEFRDGAVSVPTAPGLGVEIDEDSLAQLHEQYVRCGVRRRDDVTHMRRFDPGFTGARPRFT